ncbi:MAG: hypothetical protein ACSHYB_19625 [Roseibacillus sp.]
MMNLATSTGYGPYLVFWILPFLIVAAVGLLSLFEHHRSGERTDLIWKWQRWSLIMAAVFGILVHCSGLIQIRSTPEDVAVSNPKWREDGEEVIRLMDSGFFVIIGFGVILLLITLKFRTLKKNRGFSHKAE